jgi:hypothetical protein
MSSTNEIEKSSPSKRTVLFLVSDAAFSICLYANVPKSFRPLSLKTGEI